MGAAKKYIKKPVEVEAYQFRDWSDAIYLFNWTEGKTFYVPRGAEHVLRRANEFDRSTGNVLEHAAEFLVILTLEGHMRADRNDFVIKGVKGEFYPCKPDIFKETYDQVEP